MDVTINFVIFCSFLWTKLALKLDHVDFMRPTALREYMSFSYICVAVNTLDYNMLTCKSDNRVKSQVSNERKEAEIMSIFSAFEH